MATATDNLPDLTEETNGLVEGKQNLATVVEAIGHIPYADSRPTPRPWYLTMGIAFLLCVVFLQAVGWLLAFGVGVWGLNIPSAWGFAIVNFVWWIGIGHAGTLISAILLLFHQKWRTSINRFAEAMTLFAVMCAGMFPLLHMGRPWFFYWLYPYPNTFAMWPQFRSPLVWDVFAVSTYFTISAVFWYVGLIPDLATLRDRAGNRLQRTIYGMMAMGWRGSAVHWRRYEKVYLILAGISTPLVLSVHTVVSFDFAVSIVPLWHATIFPPFFVAGAIFSGFAGVVILGIMLRAWYPSLKDFITRKHLDLSAQVMLGTGMLVCYGYFCEFWMAWYSHAEYEWGTTLERMFGPYGWSYWALIFCNFVCIQPLWSKWVRNNDIALFIISMIVMVGMWFERYVIVITLTREYLPSMWGRYAPTYYDYALYAGTIGVFLFLFLLFCRFLPIISITEMREMLPKKAGGGDGHGILEGPP